MEVLYPRCAGLDVHKERVTACRRVASEGGKAKQEVRSFSTTTSGLLDLVNAMFEEAWSNAPRLFAERAEVVEPVEAPVDRDLLKLLLLGLTDAAAGAQLGISVRTVQRRVAELMELAEVTTRIQLGAEAVRRGWV